MILPWLAGYMTSAATSTSATLGAGHLVSAVCVRKVIRIMPRYEFFYPTPLAVPTTPVSELNSLAAEDDVPGSGTQHLGKGRNSLAMVGTFSTFL